MTLTPDDEAELHELTAMVAGTEWRFSVTHEPHAGSVCLQLDRPSSTAGEETQTLVFCRRSLTLAVNSARKHIFKQSSA